MRIVPFVQASDPHHLPRLGAVLEDDTLVDLQAGHFAMTGRPATLFADADAFARSGGAGVELAARVVAWVASQRPPGTTTTLGAVRALAPVLDVEDEA
jgi:hypothetical protein